MKTRPEYPFKKAPSGERPKLDQYDYLRIRSSLSSPNHRFWIKPPTANFFDLALKEQTAVEPRIPSRIQMPDWALRILKEKDDPIGMLLGQIKERLVSRRSKNDNFEAGMILTELSRTPTGSRAVKEWLTPDLLSQVIVRKRKIRRRS